MNTTIVIRTEDDRPRSEAAPPAVDAVDIVRAMDQTLMSIGQRIEGAAKEDGTIAAEDLVRIVMGIMAEACGDVARCQGGGKDADEEKTEEDEKNE